MQILSQEFLSLILYPMIYIVGASSLCFSFASLSFIVSVFFSKCQITQSSLVLCFLSFGWVFWFGPCYPSTLTRQIFVVRHKHAIWSEENFNPTSLVANEINFEHLSILALALLQTLRPSIKFLRFSQETVDTCPRYHDRDLVRWMWNTPCFSAVDFRGSGSAYGYINTPPSVSFLGSPSVHPQTLSRSPSEPELEATPSTRLAVQLWWSLVVIGCVSAVHPLLCIIVVDPCCQVRHMDLELALSIFLF